MSSSKLRQERNSVAQRGSGGWEISLIPKLSPGRAALSQYIFGIKFHVMLFKQRQILVLKTDLTVMDLLILDVLHHGRQVGSAHAKCAVPLLPCKLSHGFVHPF